jgi:hypothetical protein
MKNVLSALLIGSTILVSVAANAQVRTQDASVMQNGAASQTQRTSAADDRSSHQADYKSYGSTTYGRSQSSYSHSPRGVIPFVAHNSLYSHN